MSPGDPGGHEASAPAPVFLSASRQETSIFITSFVKDQAALGIHTPVRPSVDPVMVHSPLLLHGTNQ